MDLSAAKELIHIQGWLERVEEITRRGKDAYVADPLLQEDGDSPKGVRWAIAIANRNFLIHQYDDINRDITWETLSRDLFKWRVSLEAQFAQAQKAIRHRAAD